MTKEESIKVLTQYIDYDAETPDYYEMEKACKVAIKALEQEPCEDCISRAEARKHIYQRLWESALNNVGYECKAEDVFMDIADNRLSTWISELPSIQPKPMQVELEGDGYADGELVYDYGKCPKCGWEFVYGEKDWEEPYCCHCGQKLHWFESEEEE